MTYLLENNNKMKFFVEIEPTNSKTNDAVEALARFIGKANVELATNIFFPIGTVIRILRMGESVLGKVIYANHSDNSVLLSVKLIDSVN